MADRLVKISGVFESLGGGGGATGLVWDDDFTTDQLATGYVSPGAVYEGNSDLSAFDVDTAAGALRGTDDTAKAIAVAGLSLTNYVQQIECHWKDEAAAAIFALTGRMAAGAKTCVGHYQNQTGIRTYGWTAGVFSSTSAAEVANALTDGTVTWLTGIMLGGIGITISTDYDPIAADKTAAAAGWNAIHPGYPSASTFPPTVAAGACGIVFQGNGQVPASGTAHEVRRYRVWSLD